MSEYGNNQVSCKNKFGLQNAKFSVFLNFTKLKSFYLVKGGPGGLPLAKFLVFYEKNQCFRSLGATRRGASCASEYISVHRSSFKTP